MKDEKDLNRDRRTGATDHKGMTSGLKAGLDNLKGKDEKEKTNLSNPMNRTSDKQAGKDWKQ